MRRVKKKKGGLALKTKLWLGIILILSAGSVWFYRSEYRTKCADGIRGAYVSVMKKTQMVLKQAIIEGHIRTKKEDIQAVAELSLGMPIFDVDLNEIHEKISQLPWIKSVLIERKLPSYLVISVTEKKPIAVWQNNKKYLPLDEAGEPIMDEKAPLTGLILVVGQDAPKKTPALLNILDQYPMIRDRVKSAVRVGNRRWDLRLDKVDGMVVKLPEKNVEKALLRLQVSMEKEKLFQKDITSIDLGEEDRLIVTTGGKK